MSVLGKVYLGVSLSLLVLGVVWASSTLQANAAWVEIVLAVPRPDLIEPLQNIRYQVNLAALMAGWLVAVVILAVQAIRAPFRIRVAARTRRRIKDLEDEVLTLRRLPLRQQEEDELLAAHAQLEDGTRKVMTEKLMRDELEPEPLRTPPSPLRGEPSHSPLRGEPSHSPLRGEPSHSPLRGELPPEGRK